jgi:hypothetical protein
MSSTQFRIYDPVAGLWDRGKTTVTKSLRENFLLQSAIQTLIPQKIYADFFIQDLVEMQEIGFKNQVILDFILEFGFHFSQNTFVPHCFLFIFIGNELLYTSGLILILI